MLREKADAPLFPRTNASPYSFVLTPLTYSSVCSSAMFMYPSRQLSVPVRPRRNPAEVLRGQLAVSSRREGRERERTSVVDSAIEPDDDLLPDYTLEEGAGSRELLLFGLRRSGSGFRLRGRRGSGHCREKGP